VKTWNSSPPTARWQSLAGAAIVAIGFVVLMPPRALEGRYSILEVSLALLAVVSLFVVRGRVIAPVGIPTSIVALLLLMLSSSVWSVESWTTLRDGAAYCILAVVAWCLASTVDVRSVVLGIVVGGALALVLSVFALVVDPTSALHNGSAGFQGIFGNRNTLGYVVAQALPAALVLHVKSSWGQVMKWGIVGSFVAATVATTSQTSLVVVCLTLFVWVTVMISRRWKPVVFAAIALSVVGLGLVVLNLNAALALIGKDPLISGRVLIWQAVLEVFPQSPVVGFGWSRSWSPDSPQSSAVSDSTGKVLSHAHNEVLNWLTTTGVVGAVLAVSVYGFVLWAGVRFERGGTEPERLWPLLAGVTIVTRGLAEISETNAQGWFVLMLVAFVVARHVTSSSGGAIPWPLLVSVGSIGSWSSGTLSSRPAGLRETKPGLLGE
jgi:O-antigen ligase